MKRKISLIGTIGVKYFIRCIHYICSIFFPIKQNKVTFASYRSEKLSGNLYYVHDALAKQVEGVQCTFLFKRYTSSFKGKVDYVVHMVKASYHLATSRYFFIDDYYFPVYAIKPRKGTEIIQLWHAAGAFKKFGYSTVGKSFGTSEEYLKHIKIHSNYSYAMVSGAEVIPYYAEAFRMEEDRVLPLGIPRTDYFFQPDKINDAKKNFFTSYPELKEKKLILYAPTFRGKSHYQGTFECPIDIKDLKNTVGDEYCLLIHLHPYMKGIELAEDVQDFAYHITGEFNIQEILCVTDILITDYSSVIFDFSLLKRPIAFFSNDLEEYMKERDFYYDFKKFIPGPYFTDTKELAKWLQDESFNIEAIEAFRDRFFDYVDGKASERIVNYFFERKEG